MTLRGPSEMMAEGRYFASKVKLLQEEQFLHKQKDMLDRVMKKDKMKESGKESGI